jgi:hypothetical protein
MQPIEKDEQGEENAMLLPHNNSVPVGDHLGSGQGESLPRQRQRGVFVPQLSGGHEGRAHAAGNCCARHCCDEFDGGAGGREAAVVSRGRGPRLAMALENWGARAGAEMGTRARASGELGIRRAPRRPMAAGGPASPVPGPASR